MKRVIAWYLVFLIVLSSVAAAEGSQEECGFFCRFFGGGNVAGRAAVATVTTLELENINANNPLKLYKASDNYFIFNPNTNQLYLLRRPNNSPNPASLVLEVEKDHNTIKTDNNLVGSYANIGPSEESEYKWISKTGYTLNDNEVKLLKTFNIQIVAGSEPTSQAATPAASRIPVTGTEREIATANIPSPLTLPDSSVVIKLDEENYNSVLETLSYLGFQTTSDQDPVDAIKSYQTAHKLKPDGIIGKNTLDSINKDLELERKRITEGIKKPGSSLSFIVDSKEYKSIGGITYTIVDGNLKDPHGNIFDGKTGKLKTAGRQLAVTPAISLTKEQVGLVFTSNAQLEQELSKLEAELQQEQEQLTTAIEKDDRRSITTKQRKIKQLNERITQYYDEFKKINTDLGQDSLALIRSDLRDFQRGKSDTSHRQAAIRASDLAKTIRGKYSSEVIELNDKVNSLDSEIKTKGKTITDLTAQIKTAEEQNKPGLYQEKTAVETELKTLNEEKTKVEAELDTQCTQLDCIPSQIDLDQEYAEKLEEYAESVDWQGTWLEGVGSEFYTNWIQGKNTFSQYSGAILQGVGQLGDYRALSSLLFPDIVANTYFKGANEEVFRRLATAPSFARTVGLTKALDICSDDDLKSSNQPGQNYLFIETPSGIRQPVATISGEKSAAKVFLPCTENEDGELACKEEQVCKTDKFCYLNRDAVQPITANFYKITWGVGVPGDVSFTPYIDEAGQAVKFNIQLSTNSITKYLYQRGTESELSVLSLENGATDGDTVAFYSEQDYNSVCIKFDSSYQMKDFRSGDKINELCGKIEPSTSGTAEFLDSKREQPSVTTQAEDVAVNRDI